MRWMGAGVLLLLSAGLAGEVAADEGTAPKEAPTRTSASSGTTTEVPSARGEAGDPLAKTEAVVWAAGEGARILRGEARSPLSRGEGNWIWQPGEPIRIAALRGEVVGFQVVVTAQDAPLEGVEVTIEPLRHEGGAPGRLEPETFVQHYVEVKARSRNAQHPAESLGWTPGARPPDTDVTGWLPDALIPLSARTAGLGRGQGAGGEGAPGRAFPWPLAIAPRQNGAIWVDVLVPEQAAAGLYTGKVRTTAGDVALGGLDVQLTVADAVLPYRPVNVFAYYDAYQMANRLGDRTPAGATASESQVWQLLHQHHVDALPPLTRPDEIERMRAALDGSLFTEAHGYRGPGVGVAPAVLALGTYGDLGEPNAETLARAEALAERVPEAIREVFVYAIDEQCDSPRGPGWKKLLQGSKIAGRVRVGHTCGRDPSRQDVDVVMVPAQRFDARTARAARALGKEVWVYNGALPQAGTFMIDAPITSLLANGWIAASYPVGRWFLWEVGFWHDGNRGGKGPIDPFVQPENFHNDDGDACLGDGMLLYPGTQVGAQATGSLGLPGVMPSLRLKALRRGIQDAGYAALARAGHTEEVDAILAKVIPVALQDADSARPAAWPRDGAAFAAAREALRALIPAGARLEAEAARRVLAEAADAREARTGAVAVQERRWWPWVVLALAVLAGVLAIAQMRRASRKA
ncbi:glycoside hydrolase domain-containing protein [Chondromyces crocatus]|uniref:Glycoside hydrolase 123 C-terminal domain-containing protein n=1 Tax=Chondromyces crocatus TaxID=52 RepID=A0A0K1EAS0_CHOCO|nr:glycoside hydrolase domain-containing protein [Chondromyces crocatus]AKT37772.1 uncharacterized protein CMC5_019140 [Chondromyces crocatus]